MSRLGLGRSLRYKRRKYAKGKTWAKSGRPRFLLYFAAVSLVLWIAFNILTSTLQPALTALCESRAQAIATRITNDVVNRKLLEMPTDDLITFQRDKDDNISALKANVIKMNNLSADIAMQVQQGLYNIDSSYLTIPIGNLLGNELLAGWGPRIWIKVIPVGNVETNFKTEFVSSGINQTIHRIYIEVKSKVRVVIPFGSQGEEVTVRVPVTETVIVGNVPSSFYNITGISDLEKRDILNLVN